MPEIVLRAACRHCGQPIEKIAAGWVNDAGFSVCQKYTGPLPVPEGGFMLHEPMPEGMRGAPKEEFGPASTPGSGCWNGWPTDA